MKIFIHAALSLLLLHCSGCVMYPRYYSTGEITGQVVEDSYRKPIANALVFAEVWIRKSSWGNGGKSKRVDSGYAVTDSNGYFRIPSLHTFYLHYGTFGGGRVANSGVSAAYHPNYRMCGRDASVAIFMCPEKNTLGISQLERHFKGRNHVSLKGSSGKAARSVISDIYNNDENPRHDDQKFFKKLMK